MEVGLKEESHLGHSTQWRNLASREVERAWMLEAGVKGKDICRRGNGVMTVDSFYCVLSFLL